jgi:hypothetical protein
MNTKRTSALHDAFKKGGARACLAAMLPKKSLKRVLPRFDRFQARLKAKK